jgi:hypothetical protein
MRHLSYYLNNESNHGNQSGRIIRKD